MPLSVSNNAGTCAAIFVMSPVILFIPAASPLPVETIVILSTLASGAARAFTISGRPLISLSTDRSLVVLLIGRGFYVHGFGLGFAFLEDDFGLGFSLSTNRRSAALSFRDQALLLGRSERFDTLTLDLGCLSTRSR